MICRVIVCGVSLSPYVLLVQSATCGIISSLHLGAPLPANWNPWADISQGQETFPVVAINEVDAEPPPTDFWCICTAATVPSMSPLSPPIYPFGFDVSLSHSASLYRFLAACLSSSLCMCRLLSVELLPSCLSLSLYGPLAAAFAAAGAVSWCLYSYQKRNILFGRLPSSSMLCLCTGCLPHGIDTSDWERM